MTQARYTIDRFEDNGWAVLEREDGLTFDIPQEWLPAGAIEGHILTLALDATAESSNLKFTIDTEATALRQDEVRKLRERLPKGPEGDIIDSQSVKITAEGAWFSGFDGNKKVKGRRRHLLVDTLGFLLSVYTTSANVGDRWGAKACIGGKKHFLPRLKTIWADGGYTGNDLAQACAGNGWDLVIVKRPQGHFEVQPKRWIVERTLAWLLKSRRLVIDYERMPQTGESFIELAMLRLMVRRLAASGRAAGEIHKNL